MTESSGVQLRKLLPTTFEGMRSTLQEELPSEKGKWGDGAMFEYLSSQAAGLIDEALSFDVFEGLARGWVVANELQDLADPTKNKEFDKTSSVHFGEHEFTTRIDPVLNLSLGGQPLCSLRFTLELAAEINTAVLEVCKGRLVAVGAAEGLVSAQLMYGSKKLHKKLESQAVKFLPYYKLVAPGMAITGSKP